METAVKKPRKVKPSEESVVDFEVKALRTVQCSIEGFTPISFGKYFTDEHERQENEKHADYDKRCAPYRCHYDKDDRVVISGNAFRLMVREAARLRGGTVQGTKGQTWATHFGIGVRVPGSAIIEPEYTLQDVTEKYLVPVHVPSDGKPGGSSRVTRWFPTLPEWKATFEVIITNGHITEEEFKKVLVFAGVNVGLGTYRPSSKSPGDHGCFKVKKLEWGKVDDLA